MDKQPDRNTKFRYRGSKETCEEKVTRVQNYLRIDTEREREVIKIDERTGMGNGGEQKGTAELLLLELFT